MTRAVPILYPLARAALFCLPSETAHEMVTESLANLPSPARTLLRLGTEVSDARLRSRIWDVDFPNPVGLAAGLDKSARSFNGLAALGFGFVEIGTVTALGQPGNPRPRVFRLPADRALLNRMGFNNPGAEVVAGRLSAMPIETVLGINVGKSKITPVEGAVEDYLRSIELLERFARYIVINVSSPNTPGLRDLQDAGPLRRLLAAAVERPRRSACASPPILVKLAPDLTNDQLDQAVDIALEEGVSGIIAVNTTVARGSLRTPLNELQRLGPGGISGAPLRTRVREAVTRIYRRTQGKMPIIGVGGISTAEDAWEMIRSGASLIQVYTGLIYEGPGLVKRINEGLLERLRDSGLRSVGEAVGSGC